MDDILEKALRTPNYYTRLILKSISSLDPELGTEINPFIQYIDRMLMKYIHDKKSSKSVQQQDETVLDEEIKDMEAQLVYMKSEPDVDTPMMEATSGDDDQNDSTMDTNPTLYLYENWKSCPIGTLPNGKVPCLDMSFYYNK